MLHQAIRLEGTNHKTHGSSAKSKNDLLIEAKHSVTPRGQKGRADDVTDVK